MDHWFTYGENGQHEQHPDTRPLLDDRDQDRDRPLRRVIDAYAVLRDPDRRAAYDRTLRDIPAAEQSSTGSTQPRVGNPHRARPRTAP